MAIGKGGSEDENMRHARTKIQRTITVGDVEREEH